MIGSASWSCTEEDGGATTLSLQNVPTLAILQNAINTFWEVTGAAKQCVTPDPWHAKKNLVSQIPTGKWAERAPDFEAVAVTGDGVVETLWAVSKRVLKTLS